MPVRSPLRRAALGAACAAALALVPAGCGGDDDPAGPTTTAAAPAPDGTGDAATDPAATDPAAPSGSGTVTLADGEAPAERTIAYTEDGFSPTSLTVGVGELFTVRADDDGIHAVRFGAETDTYTVTGGLIESFTIDAPGTYTMTDDLDPSLTATITVE